MIVPEGAASGCADRFGKRDGIRRNFRARDCNVRGRGAARLIAAQQRGKIAEAQSVENEDGATASRGLIPPVHQPNRGAARASVGSHL